MSLFKGPYNVRIEASEGLVLTLPDVEHIEYDDGELEIRFFIEEPAVTNMLLNKIKLKKVTLESCNGQAIDYYVNNREHKTVRILLVDYQVGIATVTLTIGDISYKHVHGCC